MNFNDIHLEQIQFFESLLFESLGMDVSVEGYRFLSGGQMNSAVRLETTQGFFFLKWNEELPEDFFRYEALGLDLLRNTQLIKIPEVLGFGKKGGKSYILLEYLSLTDPSEEYWKKLGLALANLHRQTAPKFGLHFDNYIGSLLQKNTFLSSWIDFFVQNRLLPQAGLAFYNGEISLNFLNRIEKFCRQLPDLLPPTQPSLLHGNLWVGNALSGDFQQPILIDPAVYYGCREAEIAFTKLFGGFDDLFYKSYQESLPLEPDFQERVGIYNIYPLLVQVNLYGVGGYLSGIEKVLQRFGCQ